MYLNGTFLGYSTFLTPQQSPVSALYNKISLYGEGYFDKVHALSTSMTLLELLAIDITTEISWDSNTIMLAEFNNNLNAGNLNLGGNVQNWEVYRLAEDDPTLVKVATVAGTEENFIDYRVPPFDTYTYSVFGVTSTEISEPLTALPVDVEFYNYFLIDEDTNTVYAFDLNAETGVYEFQQDLTSYDTFNQYPTFSQGARNYFITDITALCGTVNCDGTFTQPPNYILTLKDFVMNGRSKIFKTRKGGVYRVYTSDFRTSVMEHGVKSQPMTVSFKITQLSEV